MGLKNTNANHRHQMRRNRKAKQRRELIQRCKHASEIELVEGILYGENRRVRDGYRKEFFGRMCGTAPHGMHEVNRQWYYAKRSGDSGRLSAACDLVDRFNGTDAMVAFESRKKAAQEHLDRMIKHVQAIRNGDRERVEVSTGEIFG